MRNILFFSNNFNKTKEVKNIFKNFNINILSVSDIQLKNEPEENGNSFSENAKIKSRFGFKNSKLPCFADDTGICIEALNWRPNILTKNSVS